jgi:archaellin
MILVKKLMFSRVGLTLIILVGAVSVAGLISFTLIQYGKTTQQEKIERQINEQQIQTRQRIDQAIRENSRPSSPDDNRKWLLDRQQSRQ